MLTSSEISALGQVLNTSWGYGSTPRGDFPIGSAPQYSLKGDLVGMTQHEVDKDGYTINDGRMVIKYTTVVTFRWQQEADAEIRVFKKEAEKLISDWVKEIKTGFKDSSGRALKLKQLDTSDSVEVFHTGESLSVYTQRYRPNMHRAYYRYTAVFDVK